MDPIVTGSLISGGLKLLGGLFGSKKPKNPTVQENLVAQADGVRQASEKYGFNPLTMLQSGNTMGTGLASAGPPLASMELLTGGFNDISDVLTGETARRATANRLETDLAMLKLDKLRSGVVEVPASATAGVGRGLPELGKRSGTILPMSGDPFNPFDVSPISVTPLNDPITDPAILRAGADGGVAVPTPRLDRGSGAFVNGWQLESTPGWSPTQVIEDQYGDVASWIYGLGKGASDLGTTLGSAARKRFRPESYSKPKFP